jgi:hypothetical protein
MVLILALAGEEIVRRLSVKYINYFQKMNREKGIINLIKIGENR